MPEPAAVPVAMPVQQYCSILDLQFEINRHEIQREDKEKLAVVSRFPGKYPDTTAVIEGHTDNVGTPGHNMTLSRPCANHASEVGKRLNRRIDAVIACVSDRRGWPWCRHALRSPWCWTSMRISPS